MTKKFCLVAIVCLSTILNAMDRPIEQKNWLLCLPDEISNLIASYLIFDDVETEQEFVECSKIPQIISDNLHEIINQKFQLPFGSKGGLIALCPNNITCIYLEVTYRRIPELFLGIANIAEDKLPTRHTIPIKNYKKVALSSNAQLFATIHTKLIIPLVLDHNLGALWENRLIIRKIDSDEKQIITLNPLFKLTNDHHTIAFNKQGTHLIIHGVDHAQDIPEPKNNTVAHHIIFPIDPALQDNPHDKKTLKHYLFHKGVYIKNWNCKKSVNADVF